MPTVRIPAQINAQWLEEHQYLMEDVWTIHAHRGDLPCRLVCWIALEESRRWCVQLSVNDEVSAFPICKATSRARALVVAEALRQAVITIQQENTR